MSATNILWPHIPSTPQNTSVFPSTSLCLHFSPGTFTLFSLNVFPSSLHPHSPHDVSLSQYSPHTGCGSCPHPLLLSCTTNNSQEIFSSPDTRTHFFRIHSWHTLEVFAGGWSSPFLINWSSPHSSNISFWAFTHTFTTHMTKFPKGMFQITRESPVRSETMKLFKPVTSQSAWERCQPSPHSPHYPTKPCPLTFSWS